ncbi:rpoC2 [Acrasis kona]|uniref:RpoC2 n=1 Tax=Acrasis kona TaxID=1008807 RepID=A0AAW2ZC59_9EUKA
MHAVHNPQSSLLEYTSMLLDHNHEVSRQYVSNFFRSIRWSFKQPINTLMYKYTQDNIRYYGHFLAWINTVDPQTIRFFDESKFISKSMHRTQCIRPVGQGTHMRRTDGLSKSYSLLLTTNTRDQSNPLFIDLIESTVDQYTILGYTTAAVQAGIFQKGDFFILDNAKIHSGLDTFPTILRILESVGVTIV